MIRAFRFDTEGLDDPGIVFTTSASKARYAAYASANDAGFAVDFKEIKVRRAPEFDCRLTLDGKIPAVGFCFVEHHLQRKTTERLEIIKYLEDEVDFGEGMIEKHRSENHPEAVATRELHIAKLARWLRWLKTHSG